MRPLIVLISLLALLALGGIAFFLFFSVTPQAVEGVPPPAIEAAAAPARNDEVVAPRAQPDAAGEALAGAERTSIAPAELAAKPAAKPGEQPLLVGRVVDSAGQGIEGALVSAGLGDHGFRAPGERSDPHGRLSAISDAQGRFELSGAKPGSLRLSVRADGFAPLNKAGIGIPVATRHDLGEFRLETSVVLEGRVIDKQGAPVAGARLERPNQDGVITFNTGEGAQSRPPPLATTAADGSFRINQLATGPWRLRISSETHPDKLESGVTQRPGERVVGLAFVLEDGFEISGRVRGVPAAALATASVVASALGSSGDLFLALGEDGVFGEERRKSSLGNDGSFTIRGLREGSYNLQARTPGTKETIWPRSASERVEAKTGDQSVLLVWQPASTLSFQLVDAKTRQPIEKLYASARVGTPMIFIEEEKKDEALYPEGRVQLDDLRPRSSADRATLDVEATGYQKLHRAEIALVVGGATDLGVIELQRMPTLSVKVVDAGTRAPIADARVELRVVESEAGEDGGSPGGGSFRARRAVRVEENHNGEVITSYGSAVATARTDAQGMATLNAAPGKQGKLQVQAAGYAPWSQQPIAMPEDGDLELIASLDLGGSVEITLLSADGQPVSGGRVEHRAPEPDADPFSDPFARAKGAATDAEGKVLIANLAPGLHRFKPAKAPGASESGMVFAIEGMDRGSAEWSEVEVVRGTTASLVLREPKTAELSGRISESSIALAGASLSLRARGGDSSFDGLEDMPFAQGPRAKTDGEGKYKFEKVEAGSYDLIVRHATRSMPARFPVEIDEDGVELDIDLPVSILEGRVLDLAGKPVVGAKVSAERSRGDGERGMRMVSIAIGGPLDGDGEGMVFDSSNAMGQSSARTDEQGRFTLRGVESDVDLVVRVDAKDCEPTASDPLSVALGQTRRGVDISVAPAGRIKVKIVPAPGSSPGPCLVTAEYLDTQPEGKSIEPKTEFAQGGTVNFKGLRPGRWKLQAQSLGGFGEEQGGAAPEAREVLVVAHEVATVELPGP